MPTPIRLVCFDLGGVLLRICRSWEEGCRAAGLECRVVPERLESFVVGWPDLNRAYQSGRITGGEFYARFSALTDGAYAPEDVERVHDAWILGAYAGTVEVIDALHAAGIETAALSNSCVEHWPAVLGDPAVRALGRRIGSHEIDAVKPDEAAYRTFERITGHAPEAILFFDDTPDNVEAAKRYGWSAELVDPLVDTAPQLRAALVAHGALGEKVEESKSRKVETGN